MSLTLYIAFMSLGTLIAGGAWGLVLYYFDPLKVGVLAVAAFYVTFFLFLIGLFALIGLATRRFAKKGDLIFKQVNISFRQGIWFALVLMFALFLQSRRMLSVFNIFLFILIFAIIEFVFIANSRKRVAG